MLSNTSTTLTKEQLFACLEYDGIEISADTISKAKNDNGEALRDIGYKYQGDKNDYSKAMAWYRLAVDQNNSRAYNDIGFLYAHALGVTQNYLTAMEYFLQAARCNFHVAMSNIGLYFLYEKGVPLDEYKALEWYIKSGVKPEKVKELNQQGIHLTEEDKKENEELKKAKSSNEQEIGSLRKEFQTLQIESQQNQQQTLVLQQERELLKQQLKGREEVVAVLHSLVQSKTNEIQLLQKDNQRLNRMR